MGDVQSPDPPTTNLPATSEADKSCCVAFVGCATGLAHMVKRARPLLTQLQERALGTRTQLDLFWLRRKPQRRLLSLAIPFESGCSH